TTFPLRQGAPVQIVAPPREMDLVIDDFGASGEATLAERRERARAILLDEARRPFDLTRGPLLRPRLLRISPTEHTLLLHMHHIVADAPSRAVLRRELSILYRSLEGAGRSQSSASKPTSPSVDDVLPAPKLQYGDYCEWQHRELRGELMERQLAYWKRRLAGA